MKLLDKYDVITLHPLYDSMVSDPKITKFRDYLDCLRTRALIVSIRSYSTSFDFNW